MPESPDLILRDILSSDWPAVHAYASDPEVVRFEAWGPNTEEETQEFVGRCILARMAKPRKSYDFAVTLRGSGLLIGGAGLRVDHDAREGEIGYTLARSYWGRGYGTQVARALIAYGFEELGLVRIRATCHPENAASVRVLEKAGMSLVTSGEACVFAIDQSTSL